MAAHFIRPRETWLDPAVPWDHITNGLGKFYVCPPFLGWSAIRDIVIHYPGADWADPDINNDGRIDTNDTVALLRAGHRGYLLGSRGYSYGYGFKVGTVGDIWEIRGWRNTNAANLGDAAHNHVGWNGWSISIQIVVDDADPAIPAQVDAVNWLIAEIVARKGAPMTLTWHGAGQGTACAGVGIINQIKSGAIHLPTAHPVDPTPPEDDMPAIAAIYVPGDAVKAAIPNPKWFALLADGGIRHAAGPDVAYADSVSAKRFTIEGVEHYQQLDAASQK